MNFFLLSPDKVAKALDYFTNMPSTEKSPSDFIATNGDNLFGIVGPGNDRLSIEKAYERFYDYEKLLELFRKEDLEKYKNMHKGTPFYFLGWLAFDLGNYTKGLFYIDSAIAEDAKHRSYGLSGEAAQFYTLDRTNELTKRTVDRIRKVLESQITSFCISHSITFGLGDFKMHFVEKILNDGDARKRALISAYYAFLLEFNDLHSMLSNRTDQSVSALPFLAHLFAGGLLFESLLKATYIIRGRNVGSSNKKLSDYVGLNEFRNDFDTISGTSTNELNKIITFYNSTPYSIKTAIKVTCMIRNTTGHDLIWDDIFHDTQNYESLYKCIADSILAVIEKKYIAAQ